jgi:hypothetical protein
MLKFMTLAAALIAVPVVAFGGMSLMTASPNKDSGSVQNAATSGPVTCRIKVTKQSGGMTMLEGIVTTDQAIKGSYRMRVTQKSDGGTSDMDQSGEFDAGPGKPGILNQVQVSDTGMKFDAELTVTWPGGKLTCTEASETSL